MLSPDGEAHELLNLAIAHANRIVGNDIPTDNQPENYLLVNPHCNPPRLFLPRTIVDGLVLAVDSKGKEHLFERNFSVMAVYKRLLTEEELEIVLKYL